MRITQTMMTQQFLNNITNDNQRMSQLEQELSTGKQLNSPSDNPLAVSQDMGIRAILAQTQGFQSTISAGLTWMNNTAGALQNIISGLQTIRTQTVEGLNGTSNTPAVQQALAKSVQQVTAGIYQTLDSQQGNRYLFGGAQTGAAPSAALSGAVGALNYQVANNSMIQVNVTASSLFLTTPTGASGNLQQTLGNIAADLQAGNTSGLQTDLADLSANLTNVVNANADLGTRINRLTSLQNQMAQYNTTMTNQKGVIEDANMAKVITQFNTDQTVYTAALKMGAQILLPALVNFLP
ncbi:MAG: flagellin N-terminal helical domain-containing protein [Bacilli bacterium]